MTRLESTMLSAPLGALLLFTRPPCPTKIVLMQSTDRDQERIQSAKVGVAATLAGAIADAPIALLTQTQAFQPQWEFDHDALALTLALFGVVYRYAVRNDDNPMLKQGVVGAFVLTRALSALTVSPQCTALPLSCGLPLGYLDWKMIAQLTLTSVESAIAFGVAALALEFGFDKGWLRRLG